MNTIILPGYSLHNRIWAHKVKENLAEEVNVLVHEWRHWNNPSSGLDIGREVSNILHDLEVRGKSDVIAKSIGTLVCMRLIAISSNKINKIVLCGIPLNDLREENFNDYGILKSFDYRKVVVIQNNSDPHGNFRQVYSFIKKINSKVKIIEKEADNHDYPYYEDFNLFLSGD